MPGEPTVTVKEYQIAVFEFSDGLPEDHEQLIHDFVDIIKEETGLSCVCGHVKYTVFDEHKVEISLKHSAELDKGRICGIIQKMVELIDSRGFAATKTEKILRRTDEVFTI